MLHKKKIFISILSLVFFIGTSSRAFADAGIIQCGRTGKPMCTLCDLIVGINTIIKYGFGVATFLALALIVYGAVMYIVSAGESGMIESAKTTIKNALIGIVIVFSAWLIINYSMKLLGTKTDLGITQVSGWSNFTCN